jgi:hypothetical protein
VTHAGFVVRRVGVADDSALGAVTVGIADDPAGRGRCLLFHVGTRAEWDIQDVGLDQDTYSITDEVQNTTYGGVTHCVLSARELHLRFTLQAARALMLHQDCRFVLAVDEASIDELRDGLRRVLSTGWGAPAELVL